MKSRTGVYLERV